jgi:O-methyltransferase
MIRSPYALVPRFRYDRDMVSPEQVGNLEVLLTMVLSRNVPGDIVELGCYTGSTAVVIGTILGRHAPARSFHVHDRFDVDPIGRTDIQGRFKANMDTYEVLLPIIHRGDLVDTVPSQLPDRIAFAHLDCGFGGDADEHADLVSYCLEGLYPRLSTGAILVLMDHHVPGVTRRGFNANPGSRIGADRFFADKPETIVPLYGGACSHAYVLKE